MSFRQIFGTAIVSKYETYHQNRCPTPKLPTLADIQRRGAELLGSLPFHQAEQELPPALEQPHPASPAPPQLRDSGDPTCPGVPWGLPAGALHGLTGKVVRTGFPRRKSHIIVPGQCCSTGNPGSGRRFRGFLLRKTTRRELYRATVIAKVL
jgi:hypothetical protein